MFKIQDVEIVHSARLKRSALVSASGWRQLTLSLAAQKRFA